MYTFNTDKNLAREFFINLPNDTKNSRFFLPSSDIISKERREEEFNFRLNDTLSSNSVICIENDKGDVIGVLNYFDKDLFDKLDVDVFDIDVAVKESGKGIAKLLIQHFKTKYPDVLLRALVTSKNSASFYLAMKYYDLVSLNLVQHIAEHFNIPPFHPCFLASVIKDPFSGLNELKEYPNESLEFFQNREKQKIENILSLLGMDNRKAQLAANDYFNMHNV